MLPGFYVFNTEAHPIDGAALHCCGADKQRDDARLQHLHDTLDVTALFELVDDASHDDVIEQYASQLLTPVDVDDSDDVAVPVDDRGAATAAVTPPEVTSQQVEGVTSARQLDESLGY